MRDFLAEVNGSLAAFVSAGASVADIDRDPAWQDHPYSLAMPDGPLWSNRGAFAAGASSLLDIGAGAGMLAVAALGLAPGLRYCGLEAPAATVVQAVVHRLSARFPGQTLLRLGEPDRVLAALTAGVATQFDRVRINGAASFSACRALLFEAARLCRPDALILVEYCDVPHINEAVTAVLAEGAFRVARLPGWRHVPEQVVLERRPAPTGAVEPAETRVILVTVFGDSVRAEWAISRPSVAAYAQRVGAELVELSGDLPAAYRPIAKLVALDRFERDARVLLLDTDIIIRAGAPDLFDIVPRDAVGLFLEGQVADRIVALRDTLAWHGAVARKPFYANTGVFMVPRDLVRRFSLAQVATTLHIDRMYEQGYFNALLHQMDYPVFNLSPLFNCMPWVTPERRAESFFIHFAGGATGQRYHYAWYESRATDSDVHFRIERELKAKELRVFDMRNEMRAAAGVTDKLLPATHLQSDGLLLLARRGSFALHCPPGGGMRIWGPYLQLPPGEYTLDVLVSEAAFRAAYLDGIDPSAAMLFPGEPVDADVPTHVIFDLTGQSGELRLVPLAVAPIVDGRVRATFALDRVTGDIECRVYGGEAAVDFYGLRLQAR